MLKHGGEEDIGQVSNANTVKPLSQGLNVFLELSITSDGMTDMIASRHTNKF